MSKFGSGHHWSGQKERRIGQHPSLDVRQQERSGLLRPRRSIATTKHNMVRGPHRST